MNFRNGTFFKFAIPFKIKINLTLIQVLVTLNKLLFPGILFLRIICNVITFPIIQIFFLPFNS